MAWSLTVYLEWNEGVEDIHLRDNLNKKTNSELACHTCHDQIRSYIFS